LGVLVLVAISFATPASAVDLLTYPSDIMGFSLGSCCTDDGGSVCSTAYCIVNEMCSVAPYTECSGENGNADAVVSSSGPAYPPAFTACDMSSPHMRIESSFDPATRTYIVSDGLLKWDTSRLARAGVAVTGAVLQLVTDGRNCAGDTGVSADDKWISGDWYNWDEPAVGCDRSDTGSGGGPIAFESKRIQKTGCYQVINFDLQNTENINPTGATYLRLHITPDTAPTGTNAFEFTAVEELYVAPRLFVKYGRP